MNEKRLYRSRNNRVICGVCGGIAKYLEIDATLVRVVCVCFFGLSIMTYIIVALIIPEEPF